MNGPSAIGTWAALALALGACTTTDKAAPPTSKAAAVAPAPEEPPTVPAPGQGEPDPAPPAPAQQEPAPQQPEPPVAEQAPPDDAQPVAAVDPERRLLSAYREIYCRQKSNDQRGVIAVWQQYGYDSASWATEAQAAAKRAAEDPKGFGARWAQISAQPCP